MQIGGETKDEEAGNNEVGWSSFMNNVQER